VYRCAGDDSWIAIAVHSDAAWHGLRDVVDEPSWRTDPALELHTGRHAAHDAIDAVLTRFCAARDADTLAEQLVAVGTPAAVVIASRDIARNPQLRHRGLFEIERHEVTGDCELPTLPFRFSSVVHWMHRPSPTLGQHNREVLGELGLSDDHISELFAAGVIGDRVPGA
jgi:crotonobetainyl-CoA:carnitine CoA-transferase CaiB-like acyl-CoA transferase